MRGDTERGVQGLFIPGTICEGPGLYLEDLWILTPGTFPIACSSPRRIYMDTRIQAIQKVLEAPTVGTEILLKEEGKGVNYL